MGAGPGSFGERFVAGAGGGLTRRALGKETLRESRRDYRAEGRGSAKQQVSHSGNAPIDQIAKEPRHDGQDTAQAGPSSAHFSQHRDCGIGLLQESAVSRQDHDAVGERFGSVGGNQRRKCGSLQGSKAKVVSLRIVPQRESYCAVAETAASVIEDQHVVIFHWPMLLAYGVECLSPGR